MGFFSKEITLEEFKRMIDEFSTALVDIAGKRSAGEMLKDRSTLERLRTLKPQYKVLNELRKNSRLMSQLDQRYTEKMFFAITTINTLMSIL